MEPAPVKTMFAPPVCVSVPLKVITPVETFRFMERPTIPSLKVILPPRVIFCAPALIV